MKTIAVLGTFDTKAPEHLYVAECIRARGHQTLLIDVGTSDSAPVQADVPSATVRALLEPERQVDFQSGDRGTCVAAMAVAAERMLQRLHSEQRIDGVISLGGGGGTAIATAAMRGLPIGFPKLMVSTLASGNTAHYVGTKDIVMMPSIVDVAGLNRISRLLLAQAAGAICGMVETAVSIRGGKPVLVISMFGNTTRCVQSAKSLLEDQGYEVLVFHATGSGGRAMEALIESGMVAGVLDITTTEWADELVGGVLTAGPTRLEAAGKAAVPTIVVPGCLDMVNFGEPQTLPEKFRQRRLYQHNPQVTLMRTDVAENRELGRILAAKLNEYRGPVSVLLPRGGISVLSEPGQPFHDPAADEALFQALKDALKSTVRVIERAEAINDSVFAQACVEEWLMLKDQSRPVH